MFSSAVCSCDGADQALRDLAHNIRRRKAWRRKCCSTSANPSRGIASRTATRSASTASARSGTRRSARDLDKRVALCAPRPAQRAELARFHTAEHIERVESQSRSGQGYLDYGDTPAFPGMFEAASAVTGTALDGLERIMAGEIRRTFQPVGGLHHARPHTAAGFCVFNDLGLAIRTLREIHGVRRVAYVDIDVHHGDGVLYTFEDDPELIFADIHEDGRYLYPGTGHAHETGIGRAQGTKLNLPLAPGAGDRDFYAVLGAGARSPAPAPARVHPVPVRRRQPAGRPACPPAPDAGVACARGAHPVSPGR
ncbi:MAG: hypothetical protein MZW92_67855 [Comamonadaceae bacterium]|nr:hypothetical protein [Comamonadaceae bacterium]